MTTTIQDKDVTISKPQHCLACLREFQAGTKMRYWAGLYEGVFNTCYTCQTCDAIMTIVELDGYTEACIQEWCQSLKFDTPEQWLESLHAQQSPTEAQS